MRSCRRQKAGRGGGKEWRELEFGKIFKENKKPLATDIWGNRGIADPNKGRKAL